MRTLILKLGCGCQSKRLETEECDEEQARVAELISRRRRDEMISGVVAEDMFGDGRTGGRLGERMLCGIALTTNKSVGHWPCLLCTPLSGGQNGVVTRSSRQPATSPPPRLTSTLEDGQQSVTIDAEVPRSPPAVFLDDQRHVHIEREASDRITCGNSHHWQTIGPYYPEANMSSQPKPAFVPGLSGEGVIPFHGLFAHSIIRREYIEITCADQVALVWFDLAFKRQCCRRSSSIQCSSADLGVSGLPTIVNVPLVGACQTDRLHPTILPS
ncbi:unnamed protein product [Soboliphyme baturini]|uniref:Uncharacterized protein n=1 Tax=Soboliphyme baturini TaxID=241478 RepID=A0A183IQ31_9BILA|nr:unnamed protein product [Soboliphyme baturini]